ncbi:MAG TPA: hypothetical protein VJT68_02070 [Thermoleophilaceae bacterium]|nr:hypothetical protein [Thermoleophilaceae bacterium]
MTASILKKNTALATVLAVAAMASPASAAPIESMLPSDPGGSSQSAATAEAPQTVTVSSPSGFDWGDAGIGAAGALSLLTLGAGSVLVTRRGLRAPAS